MADPASIQARSDSKYCVSYTDLRPVGTGINPGPILTVSKPALVMFPVLVLVVVHVVVMHLFLSYLTCRVVSTLFLPYFKVVLHETLISLRVINNISIYLSESLHSELRFTKIEFCCKIDKWILKQLMNSEVTCHHWKRRQVEGLKSEVDCHEATLNSWFHITYIGRKGWHSTQ